MFDMTSSCLACRRTSGVSTHQGWLGTTFDARGAIATCVWTGRSCLAAWERWSQMIFKWSRFFDMMLEYFRSMRPWNDSLLGMQAQRLLNTTFPPRGSRWQGHKNLESVVGAAVHRQTGRIKPKKKRPDKRCVLVEGIRLLFGDVKTFSKGIRFSILFNLDDEPDWRIIYWGIVWIKWSTRWRLMLPQEPLEAQDLRPVPFKSSGCRQLGSFMKSLLALEEPDNKDDQATNS